MTTRPVIRYYGGKFRLAPWIIEHFPAHKVYVEPFSGAASVLMCKAPSYSEVINDLDGEIVNLFKVLRDNGAELEKKITLTPFARDEFELSYQVCDDPLEQARRTVARAYMGFGTNSHNRPTGFRNNSNRSGTTPAHDWKHYPAAIPEIVERLRGVVIENRPASEVISRFDGKGTLFYVDPPYLEETRGNRMMGNYRTEMSTADHAALLDQLKQVKGMVVLSGYPSELYDTALHGWARVERGAHADGARDRTEVLWMNFEMVQRRLL